MPDPNEPKDLQRYLAAMHAVQSGVLMCLKAFGPDQTGATTKHLRVGIDSSQVNDAALVDLLIAKGLITLDEYYAKMADQAEKEKARYEKLLSDHYGKIIHLA